MRRARATRRDQQFHVGAQRRQRRPQFVSGVGDEPALPLPRFGERPQHRVETLGEPGEFVVAGHRDRCQVVGPGHPFGGSGEPGDRPQTGAAHRRSGRGREDDATPADDEQHPGQPVEHGARSAPGAARSPACCRPGCARPAPADCRRPQRRVALAAAPRPSSGSPMAARRTPGGCVRVEVREDQRHTDVRRCTASRPRCSADRTSRDCCRSAPPRGCATGCRRPRTEPATPPRTPRSPSPPPRWPPPTRRAASPATATTPNGSTASAAASRAVRDRACGVPGNVVRVVLRPRLVGGLAERNCHHGGVSRST